MRGAKPLPPVRPGDPVSLVAPAGRPRAGVLEACRARLESAGHPTRTYRAIPTGPGMLAGGDRERADELRAALADPDTRLVLAVRGGYGVQRMLPGVDLAALAASPKAICGYSDLTALHAAVVRHAGLVSFHGPNLTFGLGGDPDSPAAARGEGTHSPAADPTLAETTATWRLLSGELGPGDDLLPTEGPLGARLRALHPGVAEGPLVGGNLAVLVSLLGTPYEPDFDGAVLLLEDVGEASYRIDRLLTQLAQSGRLGRVAGVLLGDFLDADAGAGGPTADEVLAESLARLGVPVLAGAPIGHAHPNLPLPIGALVELDAARGLRLRQKVVEDRPRLA